MTRSFHHPREVRYHPQFEPEVKQAILASWALDAASVKERPASRKLPIRKLTAHWRHLGCAQHAG